MRLQTSAVVHDQDAASPARFPIRFRIEVEDVGAQLPPAVPARRDAATLPRVIPLQGEDKARALAKTEHAADQRLVRLAVKLRDEVLPRLREIQTRMVMQDVPVVITLPEGAFHTDPAIEHRGIRQSLAEEVMTLRSQDSLNVDPGVGLLSLKGFVRDPLDTLAIQVLHHWSSLFSRLSKPP